MLKVKVDKSKKYSGENQRSRVINRIRKYLKDTNLQKRTKFEIPRRRRPKLTNDLFANKFTIARDSSSFLY